MTDDRTSTFFNRFKKRITWKATLMVGVLLIVGGKLMEAFATNENLITNGQDLRAIGTFIVVFSTLACLVQLTKYMAKGGSLGGYIFDQ